MMEKRFVPECGDVFVFGSNRAGIHGKGAAQYAHRELNAEWGVGEGMTGRCYAIPTKDKYLRSLSLEEIQNHVSTFLLYAERHPEREFFVSRIGCGLAGYNDKDIAPMFRGAPRNVELPHGWQP